MKKAGKPNGFRLNLYKFLPNKQLIFAAKMIITSEVKMRRKLAQNLRKNYLKLYLTEICASHVMAQGKNRAKLASKKMRNPMK